MKALLDLKQLIVMEDNLGEESFLFASQITEYDDLSIELSKAEMHYKHSIDKGC